MNTEVSKYFKITGMQTVRFAFRNFGTIDLRSITLEQAKKLYNAGFPYLKLTEEGIKKYKKNTPTIPTKAVKGSGIKSASKDKKPAENEKTVKEVIELIKDAKIEAEARKYAQLRSDSLTVERELHRKLKNLKD